MRNNKRYNIIDQFVVGVLTVSLLYPLKWGMYRVLDRCALRCRQSASVACRKSSLKSANLHLLWTEGSHRQIFCIPVSMHGTSSFTAHPPRSPEDWHILPANLFIINTLVRWPPDDALCLQTTELHDCVYVADYRVQQPCWTWYRQICGIYSYGDCCWMHDGSLRYMHYLCTSARKASNF